MPFTFIRSHHKIEIEYIAPFLCVCFIAVYKWPFFYAIIAETNVCAMRKSQFVSFINDFKCQNWKEIVAFVVLFGHSLDLVNVSTHAQGHRHRHRHTLSQVFSKTVKAKTMFGVSPNMFPICVWILIGSRQNKNATAPKLMCIKNRI